MTGRGTCEKESEVRSENDSEEEETYVAGESHPLQDPDQCQAHEGDLQRALSSLVDALLVGRSVT